LYFFIFFLILLTSQLTAQNLSDAYYEILDSEFKNIDEKRPVEYLIKEFNEYILLNPNSPQEDEALYRLYLLNELRNNKPAQLFYLIKNSILHGDSPLRKKMGQIIDSLVSFTPALSLTEQNEQMLRQLNNMPSKNDYRLAYIDLISFLYSVEIKVIDPMAVKECDNYKLLFQNYTKDLDVVLFWQAKIYRRLKEYKASLIGFQKIYSIYPKSAYAPRALLEMTFLNIYNLANPQNAADQLIEMINQFPEAPETGNAQYELALLYDMHFKDEKEALTNYKLLVTAFPKNENVTKSLNRIAEISKKNGDFMEAVHSYRNIIEFNKKDAGVLNALKNLTQLYRQQLKDDESAAKTLVLTAQTFPENKTAASDLFEAAIIYREKLNNRKKEKEILDLIIAKYPDSEAAINAKKMRSN